MKKNTLNKRLLNVSGVSKSSIAYMVCKELTGLYTSKDRNGVMEPMKTGRIWGNIIRPCYTSGHGRFTAILDYTADICHIFDLLKVKYEVGNDAPRGGQTGKFIKILTKIN